MLLTKISAQNEDALIIVCAGNIFCSYFCGDNDTDIVASKVSY